MPEAETPILNVSRNLMMQSKSSSEATLETMLKRQNEMQYMAMAHALSGQPLPPDFAAEFLELEKVIKSTQIAELERKLDDMQYAAMALGLSDQPVPADFGRDFEVLKQELERLKNSAPSAS